MQHAKGGLESGGKDSAKQTNLSYTLSSNSNISNSHNFRGVFEVRVFSRGLPEHLEVRQSLETFFHPEKNLPKQTNILHFDVSSLPIGPMQV